MSSIQLAWWMQQKTQGDDAFRAGNYSDAINHYSSALRTKALQGDPAECAKIHCNRCLAFQYAQQWNYAVEDSLLAIQLQPNWFKGWYRLGSALLGCNRFEEAQLAFETAMKLNRKNTELQRRLEFAKLQTERGKDQATSERLQPKSISYNVVDFITQHAALIEPIPEEEEEVKPPAEEDPADPADYNHGYSDGRPDHMPPYDYYGGYPLPPGYPDYPGMRPGVPPMHGRAWPGPGYHPYVPMPPPHGYYGGMPQPGDMPPPTPDWEQHRYPYYPVPPPGYYQHPVMHPGLKVPPPHSGSGVSPPGSPTFSGKTNADKAEQYRLSGNGCYTDGRYEDAYAAYCKATEYNPRVAAYYANRGAAAMMLKKYWVTVDDCMKAIEVDPNYIRGYFRAAKAHMCLGNFDKALSLYHAALGKDPHSSDIREEKTLAEKTRECYFKARESMIAGKTRLALEFATLALDSSSLAIEPLMKIKCEALIALGRIEDAIEIAKEITIDGDANHPEVIILNGKVQYIGGNMEAALNLLEDATRLNPSETSPAAILLKKIKIQMKEKANGNAAFKEGNWKLAVECYTAALDADPHLRTHFIAQCATNRATALLKMNKFEEAIKDCNFALFIDSNSIKAYMRRAQAFLGFKQIESAIKDLEKVKEIDAEYPGLKEIMNDAKKELRKTRPEVDYYEVLGVEGDASEQEIKKSYKKLALRFHPDKVKDGDDRDHAEKMFKLIGEAHGLLTDPEKRNKYDAGWTLEEIENAEAGDGTTAPATGEMTTEEMFAQMFGSDYFKQGEKDFEAFVKEFSKAEFKDKTPHAKAGAAPTPS